MAYTYETGNTIRLKGTFKNNAGDPTDPTVINLIIYDRFYRLLSQYPLGSSNKVSTGVYFYDYTIPAGVQDQTYYYEFYGEITGIPALNRGKFLAKFFT